jgi:hypothetical protein
MLVAVLFFCIGFMAALLCVDLMFDTSALQHRRTGQPLPPDALNPIVSYYRYITRNPYPPMLVMLTGAICIVAEVVNGVAPPWVGWASLVLIGLTIPTAVFKVFPACQRLASGMDTAELQSHLVHRLLPYHLVALISLVVLGILQLIAASQS